MEAGRWRVVGRGGHETRRLHGERSGDASRTGASEGGERCAESARRQGRLDEGEREGRRVHLRPGPLPGDALPGAVAEAARHGRRHPRVHQGERGSAEEEGVGSGGVPGHVRSVLVPEYLDQEPLLTMASRRLACALVAAVALPLTASADNLRQDAENTLALFKTTDPAIARFFDTAVGYAVFPTVYKAGIELGGAYGKGILFEKGVATGEATLMQATFGFQLGGQAYSEVIFFQSPETLKEFKDGQFALAAQVSAVAAAEGVAKT